MNEDYERNLDLNLLRVLVVVAEEGSATAAASRLYLTQPAISAALKRLTAAVGAPLFVRASRGLALTPRGRRLVAAVRPHLTALIDASLGLEAFDPASSTRTFCIGMSDAMESWLLPALLRALQRDAPHMRFIVTQVQFRTVGRALAERHVDFAVTVADELPASVRRQPLMSSGFVCLFDPRHAGIKQRVSERAYFAHEHVIVSYNSDLRGIIEDAFGKTRRVRCSVSTFSSIGAIVDGTALLATVPDVIARHIVEIRPHLRTARLPATLAPGHEAPSVDLLWLAADDDDPASAFVRAHIAKVASRLNLNR